MNGGCANFAGGAIEGKMGLERLLCPNHAPLSEDMTHIISVRWFESPYQGRSHIPHNFWSSYENLIHYRSEFPRAH
jgi:hypothetical protein